MVIQDIAKIIGAETSSLKEAEIAILLTDSRSLSDPAVSLFFALSTPHNDGHRYIGDLYKHGVRNFVFSHDFEEIKSMPDANFLKVPDTLAALQQLAAFHRKQFDIPVVGITGSNGKTIVKEWLYQLLHDQINLIRSPRSYNSQIGVPLSVWQLSKQIDLAIFEAGISLPGEMQKLEPIILPSIGILTTIGEAHQENFKSQEDKCLEKLQLFESAETIIYNEDNSLIKLCIEKKGFAQKAFSWSKANTGANLYISGIDKGLESTLIEYNIQDIQGKITIPFTDEASIENAIHCLAFILHIFPDLFPDSYTLSNRFEKLDPVAMRLDVNKGINNNILINDTYNSDINSLSIALDFMSRRSSGNQFKIGCRVPAAECPTGEPFKQVLILSDILQSGMVPAAFYRKVAELVSQKQVQHIVGIGPNLMSHSNLFGMEKEFYPTTESYLESGRWRSLKNSVVLIKGSRQFRFERITEQLEEKAHQTVLEVDLDAVIHNLKYFRSKLRPETKVICMVKAFGYGVGSYELAKTLQEWGVDYLAVAVADEGAELRREGITMPIIVMNPEEHAFNTLFEHNLEPEIYNQSILNAIIRETGRRGILNYPVHIKLDTGMNRLGFDAVDLFEIARKLKSQQGVIVKSVFSHLAGSDSPVFDEFTKQQIARFLKEASIFEEALKYPVMKHICNSAGIERFPEAQMNMVRLGIGLYGISAVNQKFLKPVATLKTRILQIREVKQEDTVGYNRSGKLQRDSRIACLPIGYADGLDRRLGNGNLQVFITGKNCPLVGNICMDICMADVTDTNAAEGDEVILFGREITISDWAEKLQTIPYEILTSISPRVKRVYYRE